MKLRIVLSELAQGENKELIYPMPWAKTEESSFLAAPEETRASLQANGFTVTRIENTLSENIAFGTRSKEMITRGEKPPHRAVPLIHAENAAEIARNVARGLKAGQLVPIDVYCQRNA